MREIFLGIVADDFTGASDAASFLVAEGVPAILFNGVPDGRPELKEDTAAIVIALKTRTEPKDEAVAESLAAFDWLREMGAQKLYLKYCSTFDSTADGNIGPVADAVLRRYCWPCTLLCPSLPVNGRTVKDGVLYVYEVPLAESHMKDHPLTPMRDSYIPRLMEAQSEFETYLARDPKAADGAGHYYLVPDYETDEDADRIAEAYWDLPFFTGGSGLAGALGRLYVSKKRGAEPGSGSADRISSPLEHTETTAPGKTLLLAGSCSAVTLRQIADYRDKGYPCLRIHPELLLDEVETPETIWNFIENHGSGTLVYSSASPEELRASQNLGKEMVAELLERTISGLAVRAAANGYTRIISAGGETSGAVTKALDFSAFYIGPSVAPGVPVMTPLERMDIRLVLKSGNFGQEDFFERAAAMFES